jgi:hypothetical protein
MEMSLLRRDKGPDGGRESPNGKDWTMGEESTEGNRRNPGITEEMAMFRSKETGRRYAISKVLDKGLLLLESEDGMSAVITHPETIEFCFVEEKAP